MKVLSSRPGYAICDRDGAEVTVDMKLVGEQPDGTWVLTFLDSAREVIEEQTALKISNALLAVSQAFHGDVDIDHLFADLVNREPELPAHLRPQPPVKEE